ncbi:MAG: methyltransferase family protein [Hyphomicrobium sp.]
MNSDASKTSTDAAAERANTFPWPPVVFAIVVLIAWGLGHWSTIAWPGMNDGPARVIGIGFGAAGLALIAWAIASLRSHGTTILPDRASTALVMTGPYRLLRNPIYLGEVLLLLSAAELTKNVWFVAGALAFGILVTWLQIGPEERHLQARFGDAYAAYKAATRRWI